jgi:hypothetical protein
MLQGLVVNPTPLNHQKPYYIILSGNLTILYNSYTKFIINRLKAIYSKVFTHLRINRNARISTAKWKTKERSLLNISGSYI